MDTAKHPGGPTGLVEDHWGYLRSKGEDLDDAAAFTAVSSCFYPELDELYDQRAAEWVRECEVEAEEDEAVHTVSQG